MPKHARENGSLLLSAGNTSRVVSAGKRRWKEREKCCLQIHAIGRGKITYNKKVSKGYWSDHNVKPMYNHKNYSTVIIRDSRDMLRVLLVQGASLTHFRASLVNKIVRTYYEWGPHGESQDEKRWVTRRAEGDRIISAKFSAREPTMSVW